MVCRTLYLIMFSFLLDLICSSWNIFKYFNFAVSFLLWALKEHVEVSWNLLNTFANTLNSRLSGGRINRFAA
jgi:hypothetical protein